MKTIYLKVEVDNDANPEMIMQDICNSHYDILTVTKIQLPTEEEIDYATERKFVLNEISEPIPFSEGAKWLLKQITE